MGKEERGKCKYCGSQKLVKNGRVRGEQRYKCKGCGKNVTLKPRRGKPEEMKAAAILLYSVGKISMNMLGKIFKVSTVAVYKWIRQTAEKLPEPAMPAGPSEWELDEMWHFVRSKKNKCWIWKALDRRTGRTLRWVVGQRDTKTFKSLYRKIQHPQSHYFSDKWESYPETIPLEQLTQGKTHTITIERDNSNTRHHLARFTRRTKVVSRSIRMVYLSLRLWAYFQTHDHFLLYQQKLLSIFS